MPGLAEVSATVVVRDKPLKNQRYGFDHGQRASEEGKRTHGQ
jgi:hypothetical protein